MPYIKNRAIFVMVLFIWHSQSAKAQTGYSFNDFKEKKEAAVAELKNFLHPDTARVNALIKILCTAVFLKERKEVAPYLAEALAISRKLKYRKGLGNCYMQTAGYYTSASDYDNALIYYDSALYIADNTQGEDLLAIKELAFEQKGFVYYTRENYYPALDYFFESLKYPSSNTRKRKSRIYMFITEIYIFLNNLDKASEYAKKNIDLLEEDSDIGMKSTAYFPIIDICIEKKDLKTAQFYLDKMSSFIPDAKQVQVNFGYYLKMGKLKYIEKKYREAYTYFQEANKFAVTGGHANSKSTSLYFLCRTALQLGYIEAAKTYAMENFSLAEKMNKKSGKIDALINLSDYYNKTGNSVKAFEWLQQAIQLKDSVAAETNLKQLKVLGAVYEADKQQNEIARLQNEKKIQAASEKQKTILNKIFIASIIALLILGYLGYMNIRKGQQLTRHQQKLQNQKIAELEKDKQLLAIDAMMKGQEEERSRIAKDLHDGLGGLLSGTKLSFMNVKDSLVLTPKNSALFDKSLSMLDNTIGDLRKVAHNLMPEALVKFGLHEALRDFCDSIQSSSGKKIIFQQFGENRRLNSTAEASIYRIIQELLNNVLRHAVANNIVVQLTMSNNRTSITVEDDGLGFDKSKLLYCKGAGMANINYRVQYFKGTFDIVSSPGNGTSVNIELKV